MVPNDQRIQSPGPENSSIDLTECWASDVELCVPVPTWGFVGDRGRLGLPWDLGPSGASKSPTEDSRHGETPSWAARRCARQAPDAHSGYGGVTAASVRTHRVCTHPHGPPGVGARPDRA